MKLVLSDKDYRDDRKAGRRTFIAAAEGMMPEVEGAQQQLFARVVAHEEEARGGDISEPRWLQCNPARPSRS